MFNGIYEWIKSYLEKKNVWCWRPISTPNYFLVKYTIHNFNQNIDDENVYKTEEHVWYNVGYPNRNGIVGLVILVLFIVICFPILSSISLLLYREIFKHQGWRWSSSNEEIVANFIKNSLFLTLIEKINSWRKFALYWCFILFYPLQICRLNVLWDEISHTWRVVIIRQHPWH